MSDVEFVRLGEVPPTAIIDLMTNPRVRQHLPLAPAGFGREECAQFVATKERMWREHGYGPWAFLVDGAFVGWGGVQREGDDADLGLVLHPDHWGRGPSLYRRMVAHAFEDLRLPSVSILLPRSRKRVGAVLRLGFVFEGESVIDGQSFARYRLTAPTGR